MVTIRNPTATLSGKALKQREFTNLDSELYIDRLPKAPWLGTMGAPQMRVAMCRNKGRYPKISILEMIRVRFK